MSGSPKTAERAREMATRLFFAALFYRGPAPWRAEAFLEDAEWWALEYKAIRKAEAFCEAL